ncbi:hypothetical protein DFP77_10396 [Marinomonas foliarum]|uniref:Uncharacterized protein n=1 Tax=Marinomonas foliarum TaxID=491950 RepID=A0A369AFV1_9GAMM|nr:hypothetical protein DFP77_10396 [Marinomonas foliarum]
MGSPLLTMILDKQIFIGEKKSGDKKAQVPHM